MRPLRGSEVYLHASLGEETVEELSGRLEECGAAVVETVSSETIRVVPSSFDSDEFREALGSGNLLLGEDALRECLDTGTLPAFHDKSPVANLILADVVITFSSLATEESAPLGQLAGFMGARISRAYTTHVTHVVTFSTTARKSLLARERGDSVVVPAWISACWDERARLQESYFDPEKETEENLSKSPADHAPVGQPQPSAMPQGADVTMAEAEFDNAVPDSSVLQEAHGVEEVGGMETGQGSPLMETTIDPSATLPAASGVTGVLQGLNFMVRGFTKQQFTELSAVIKFHGGVPFNGGSDHVDLEPPPYVQYVIAPHGARYDRARKRIGTQYGPARPVVSPNWIESCILEKSILDPSSAVVLRPLPRRVPLKGANALQLCLTGFKGVERRQLKTLVIVMGFRYHEQLSPETKVLVCKEPTGHKSMFARKWSVPAVPLQWLLECAEAGLVLDTSSYAIPENRLPPPPKSVTEGMPVLLGATVMTNRKAVSQRQQQRLQDIAGKLGATFAWKFTDSVTHFVHQGKSDAKELKAAIRANDAVKVVSPLWLEQCLKEGRWVDEEDYPGTLNPKMALGLTKSENSVSTKRIRAEERAAGKRAKGASEYGGPEGKKRKMARKKGEKSAAELFRDREAQEALESSGDLTEEGVVWQDPTTGAMDVGVGAIEVDVGDMDAFEEAASYADALEFPGGDEAIHTGQGSPLEATATEGEAEEEVPKKVEKKNKEAYLQLERMLANTITRVQPRPLRHTDSRNSLADLSTDDTRDDGRHTGRDCRDSEDSEKSEEEGEEEEEHDSQVVVYNKSRTPRRAVGGSRRISPARLAASAGTNQKSDAAELSSVCKALTSSTSSVSVLKEPHQDTDRFCCKRDLEELAQSPRAAEPLTPPRWAVTLTGFKSQDRERLESIVLQLGGTVIKRVAALISVTHVVIDELVRSGKLIATVAKGGWVVKSSFLTASGAAGRWVDEREHEWSPDNWTGKATTRLLAAAGRRWRRWLALHTLHDKRKANGPFSGGKVLLISTRFTEQLLVSLQNGGAQLIEVETLPYPKEALKKLTHIMVGDQADITLEHLNYLRELQQTNSGVWVLDSKFITERLLRFPLVPESELLLDCDALQRTIEALAQRRAKAKQGKKS